jgi:outer membrane protein assembly factor BamB
MKRNFKLFSITISLALITQTFSVFSQDWNQWRGANRNGVVSGFTPPKKWDSPIQKWKTTVGTGDATPALVGNKLYVFTRQDNDEVISCLNVEDGKIIWSSKYPASSVTGAAASHPGPRSSPAFANGKVVTLGVGGLLVCYDANSGKELWKKEEFPKVVPQFFTAMSPLVDENLCIVHVGGKGKGAVIAYELESGNQKWRWDGDGPAYSSPVVATISGTKQVIVLTEKNLIGLKFSDGKLLWQSTATPVGRSCNAPSPVVSDNTIIFTGQGKGMFAVKIEKSGEEFAVKELWSNPDIGCEFNTPILKGEYLYGISSRGNLFCAEVKLEKYYGQIQLNWTGLEHYLTQELF